MTITVTGTLGSYGSASFSFGLTIVSVCSTATITTSTPPTTQTYVISETASVLTFTPFTVSSSFCSLTYSLLLQDSSSINTNLITFTASPSPPSMSTYSTNTALKGSYPLQLVAAVVGYSSITSNVDFTLNINDICTVTVITTQSIPNYTYDIN